MNFRIFRKHGNYGNSLDFQGKRVTEITEITSKLYHAPGEKADPTGGKRMSTQLLNN